MMVKSKRDNFVLFMDGYSMVKLILASMLLIWLKMLSASSLDVVRIKMSSTYLAYRHKFGLVLKNFFSSMSI